MQTFLPYKSFLDSIECLDKKRAWKQVVEASQIINTLSGKSEGWKNHPATRMWRGYLPALIAYYNQCHRHCVSVHKIKVNKLQLIPSSDIFELPPWWEDDRVFSSHRSNLLRKDKEFYSKFGWTEPDNLPYFWPVNLEGKYENEIPSQYS